MDFFRHKLMSYETDRELSTLLHIHVETDRPKVLIPPSKSKSYVDEMMSQYTVKMYDYPPLAPKERDLATSIYTKLTKLGDRISVFQLEEQKRNGKKKQIKKSKSGNQEEKGRLCPCCMIRHIRKHKCPHNHCEKPCSRINKNKKIPNAKTDSASSMIEGFDKAPNEKRSFEEQLEAQLLKKELEGDSESIDDEEVQGSQFKSESFNLNQSHELYNSKEKKIKKESRKKKRNDNKRKRSRKVISEVIHEVIPQVIPQVISEVIPQKIPETDKKVVEVLPVPPPPVKRKRGKPKKQAPADKTKNDQQNSDNPKKTSQKQVEKMDEAKNQLKLNAAANIKPEQKQHPIENQENILSEISAKSDVSEKEKAQKSKVEQKPDKEIEKQQKIHEEIVNSQNLPQVKNEQNIEKKAKIIKMEFSLKIEPKIQVKNEEIVSIKEKILPPISRRKRQNKKKGNSSRRKNKRKLKDFRDQSYSYSEVSFSMEQKKKKGGSKKKHKDSKSVIEPEKSVSNNLAEEIKEKGQEKGKQNKIPFQQFCNPDQLFSHNIFLVSFEEEISKLIINNNEKQNPKPQLKVEIKAVAQQKVGSEVFMEPQNQSRMMIEDSDAGNDNMQMQILNEVRSPSQQLEREQEQQFSEDEDYIHLLPSNNENNQ